MFQKQQCTSILLCFVSPHLFFFSPLQACGDPKAKPSYLVDKNLESAVKFIVRKFPAVETRNNNVSSPACTVCLPCVWMIQRGEWKSVCSVITWPYFHSLNLGGRFIFMYVAFGKLLHEAWFWFITRNCRCRWAGLQCNKHFLYIFQLELK